MIHAWRTPFWLLIAVSCVLLIAAVPTPELRAAQVATEPRCTDAAALSGRDTAYTNFSYQLRFGLTTPLPFPEDAAV